MATSWGEAAARGIETGFGLGLRADQAAEEKRARGVQEQRQAAADLRAEQGLQLQRESSERAERRLADAERRDATGRAITGLEGRRKELLAAGTQAEATGTPVPASLREEYAQVSARLAGLRQQALDDASRLATGQLSMDQMTPAQLYRTMTLGTGMTTKDLQGMPKHSADLQAGMETGNNGLVLQAVNGLMGPALRMGVNTPSPYGGTIVRKEVIGLDPARDANGVDHPGKVIPRLRVYVQRPGETGERYYDAPMTKDRSSNPDDKVAVIDIQKAMDWVGNLGVLTSMLQRPDLQQKMAQGEQEAGPEVNRYFDEFNLAIKPGKKQITRERVELGDRVLEREVGPDGRIISEKTLAKGAAPSAAGTSAKADLENRLKLLEDDYIDGLIDDNEYKRRRADLISGIKSRPAVGGGAGAGGGYTEMYGSDPAYREKVDYWANLLKAGGSLPPRFAQSGAGKAMMPDILLRVPELGGDAREMLANQSELGGAKAGARTLGTRSANFALAKQEAYEMADLVTETSRKVGRTDFMPLNRAIIAFERNTGDPEVIEYGAALNSFINTFARAVAPTGQGPTVHDKQHAREMLEAAQSHEQVEAAIRQLKKEMEAAGRSVGAVRTQQREAITGGLGLSAGGAPAPAAAPGTKPAPKAVFGSEADAAAAARAGQIRPGDRITINGVQGTWQ